MAEEVIDAEEVGTDLVERAKQELDHPSGRPDYQLAMEMGRAMSASGFFEDAQEEAQAAVKMIMGLDLGISPTAAMTAIHIVEGKPMVGYQIIAAKIKQHPTYEYRVTEHDDEKCLVEFFNEDVKLGEVGWDMERAKRANLVKEKSGWKKSPRNMLFARCLSDGVKFYMADLLTGAAVYVEGEIEGGLHAQPPPRSGPEPLTDEKAEALREEAQAAWNELRAVNPTLLVPGKFRRMIEANEYSHAKLQSVIEQIRDLTETETELQQLKAEARDKMTEEAFKAVEAKLERAASQRDKIAVVREALA